MASGIVNGLNKCVHSFHSIGSGDSWRYSEIDLPSFCLFPWKNRFKPLHKSIVCEKIKPKRKNKKKIAWNCSALKIRNQNDQFQKHGSHITWFFLRWKSAKQRTKRQWKRKANIKTKICVCLCTYGWMMTNKTQHILKQWYKRNHYIV